MTGRGGDDIYIVDNVFDTVIERSNEGIDTIQTTVDYILSSNVEFLSLLSFGNQSGTGNELDNVISGGYGKNIIDGLSGADIMRGYEDDDIYFVDDIDDNIIEIQDYWIAGFSGPIIVLGGVDTVRTNVNYILPDLVENMIMDGDLDLSSRGNDLENRLTGNSGNNILSGMGGVDTLLGGGGDDFFVVTDETDIVVEYFNEGIDQVYAYVNYTLPEFVENMIMNSGGIDLIGTGNSMNNEIIASRSNNIIDGRAGADVLIGLSGNDSYYVDDIGDQVVELANEGMDQVLASVSYRLEAGQSVETLIATGTGAIDLTGNGDANTLLGNAGANRLDGGTGADVMRSGLGNDTYLVDDLGDQAFELAGQGYDLVLSSVSYNLGGQYIENLTLTGTGAVSATGNSLANGLVGNDGANRLDGGAGADVMRGGLGNDTYVVDDAGDRVFELISQGVDLVLSSVSFNLGGQYIENLTLIGTGAASATGNSFANILVGNAAANTLLAVGGDDVLNGAGGNDLLDGGAGRDTFSFTTVLGTGNVDRIADFLAVDDTIRLARSVFTTLATGPLSATAFKDLSTGAADAGDRVLYDKATGGLSYDADGSGTAFAAVRFAILDNKAAITHLDVLVV